MTSTVTWLPQIEGEPYDPTANGGSVDTLQLFREPARTGTPDVEVTLPTVGVVDGRPAFTFTLPPTLIGRYYPRILLHQDGTSPQTSVDLPDPQEFGTPPVPRRILATDASICTPWCDPGDMVSARVTGIDPALLDDACRAASDILFNLAGNRFPGLCEITVRPQPEVFSRTGFGNTPGSTSPGGTDIGGAGSSGYAYGGGQNTAGWNPVLAGGLPGLGSYDGRGLTHVLLGVEPVQQVSQVLLAGAVVDPNTYRVDEGRWLVRQDGLAWPWVRPDAPLGAFDATVVYGQPPPAAGRRAAVELATELAQVYDGNTTCYLSGRVTEVVRQGVTIVLADPLTLAEKGLIGLPVIDTFLISVNPDRLTRLPSFSAPGTVEPRRLG